MSMNNDKAPRAKFAAMEEGTAEDWGVIASQFGPFAKKLPERVLDHLRLLDGDFGGFPIDRLEHCLQTATRAYKDDRDEDRLHRDAPAHTARDQLHRVEQVAGDAVVAGPCLPTALTASLGSSATARSGTSRSSRSMPIRGTAPSRAFR